MRIEVPRAAAPRISVIVTAVATIDRLAACLRSLARAVPPDVPCETIVVLSEATPDTESQVRDMVTGVEVVGSPVNLGMAGAGNLGRAMARGELLVLLHDDAEAEAGWLDALIETADAHPEAGAVGSKVLFPDSRLQSAGPILWRDATTSQPWVGDPPPDTTFDRVRAVDYCGTCSLLVRARAWDAVGGLDERFYPAYYVDVDICMALRQQGAAVLFQPGSRVRHSGGASGGTRRFREFVARRNRELFRKKWAAALEEHEPPETGSPAAINRALARAEAFAERCRSGAVTSNDSPSTLAVFDPARQARRHVEMARALQQAYITHLTEVLEEAEAACIRFRELPESTPSTTHAYTSVGSADAPATNPREHGDLIGHIRELARSLRESERDRTARLEQVHTLTGLLDVSEQDRAARLEQIHTLTGLLRASEADRAARLEQIQTLTKWLEEARTGQQAEGTVHRGSSRD